MKILSGVSAPIFIVGILICVASGFVSWKNMKIRNWSRAEAKVIDCSTIKDQFRPSSSSWDWTIKIRYEFTVDGKIYFGSTYSNVRANSRAESGNTGPGPSAELIDICHEYAPDTRTRIYFDPKNPDSNLVVTNYSAEMWLWITTMLFFVASLGTRMISKL